jgi:hypothetical protein
MVGTVGGLEVLVGQGQVRGTFLGIERQALRLCLLRTLSPWSAWFSVNGTFRGANGRRRH